MNYDVLVGLVGGIGISIVFATMIYGGDASGNKPGDKWLVVHETGQQWCSDVSPTRYSTGSVGFYQSGHEVIVSLEDVILLEGGC